MIKIVGLLLACLLLAQAIDIPFEVKTNVKSSALDGSSENINDKHGLFVGTVSVGTPLQDVNVVFDTNVGVLWVPNSNCACSEECSYKSVCYDICNIHCCGKKKDEPEPVDPEKPTDPKVPNEIIFDGSNSGHCTNKNAFNIAKSQSFRATNKIITETINNASIKVTIGLDRFRLGPHHHSGLNVQSIQFGTVKEFPAGYEDLPFDGVFGLARSAPSGLKSPIRQLVEANSQSQFITIYTNKNYDKNIAKGIVTIGKINTDLCESNTANLVPLINRNDWTFRIFSVTFNQTKQNDLRWTGTIDLNSPYLYVPKEVYDPIAKRLGHIVVDPITGEHTANFAMANAALQGSYISVGKDNFVVSLRALVQKIDNNSAHVYIRPAPAKGNQWILGRPFLMNRCTFLDYTGRIGFGSILDN